MHESRPAACKLPHPKRARACRRRSVEYTYQNYCMTPAAASEVLAQPQACLAGICRYESHALGLFLVPFLLDSRASCACRPALLVYGKCTEVYGFGRGRPPISRKDPFVCPARVRYRRLCCMCCGKRPALRIGRRKQPESAVRPWPTAGPFLHVSRAHVGVCGGVRILVRPPADPSEGALHMAGPKQECQAAFITAPKEAGTITRDAKTARIGRQTLANGWPISYTPRARTLHVGGVRRCADFGHQQPRRRVGAPGGRRRAGASACGG